jgi:hypothetical protein
VSEARKGSSRIHASPNTPITKASTANVTTSKSTSKHLCQAQPTTKPAMSSTAASTSKSESENATTSTKQAALPTSKASMPTITVFKKAHKATTE